PDDGFDMRGVGKEVEGGTADGTPAAAREDLQIPCQGGRVAGDVQQHAGFGGGERGGKFLGPGAGRIDDDNVPTAVPEQPAHFVLATHTVFTFAESARSVYGVTVVIHADHFDCGR